jgi:hypothetical protein
LLSDEVYLLFWGFPSFESGVSGSAVVGPDLAELGWERSGGFAVCSSIARGSTQPKSRLDHILILFSRMLTAPNRRIRALERLSGSDRQPR